MRVEFNNHMTNNLNTISTRKRKHSSDKIGLVDADLLCNGTRHPNLALLKIAGYLQDNGIPFELIIDQNADISQYTRIYLFERFARK